MSAVSLTVNGKAVTADIDPRTLLVQYLRETLRLTGTHVGCDTSQCGACVVHLDGEAIKACTVLAVQCDGRSVTTIEGLASGGELHPMQAAFREHHGLQCGYCTPGMIMTAVDLVRRKGNALDEQTIRHELEGNICRCTGYHNIVKAIAAAPRTWRPSRRRSRRSSTALNPSPSAGGGCPAEPGGRGSDASGEVARSMKSAHCLSIAQPLSAELRPAALATLPRGGGGFATCALQKSSAPSGPTTRHPRTRPAPTRRPTRPDPGDSTP